jgi:hypothetical protein
VSVITGGGFGAGVSVQEEHAMNAPAAGRSNSLRQCERQRRDRGRVRVVWIVMIFW